MLHAIIIFRGLAKEPIELMASREFRKSNIPLRAQLRRNPFLIYVGNLMTANFDILSSTTIKHPKRFVTPEVSSADLRALKKVIRNSWREFNTSLLQTA